MQEKPNGDQLKIASATGDELLVEIRNAAGEPACRMAFRME